MEETKRKSRVGYQSVENWIGRLSSSTERQNRSCINRFMTWLAENGGTFSDYAPDQLVLYQKEADNNHQYEILDLIQRYVGNLDLRASSKQRQYVGLRSLFAHNRAILPKDPTFTVKSNHLPVEGTLTAEEIRDMILSCNKLYRAVFLCMFQGGMGLDELKHWNHNGLSKLQDALRGNPEVIRVNLSGRKRKKNIKPFYTLIGPDATKALKEWMNVRPPHTDFIFTNQHGDPLSGQSIRYYWTRHLEKLGFIQRVRDGKNTHRYGKNPHEIRDVFRSLWEKTPAKGSVAEFMMGHTVDPLFYNKAFRDEDWVMEQYNLALPMLQIMSSDTPFGRVNGKTVTELLERIEQLEKKLRRANGMEERLMRIEKALAESYPELLARTSP